MDTIHIYESHSTDPYYNLAVEKQLLDCVRENGCILYLWQNQNTVVIGRNQNPWVECRISLLEEEGGKLARRLSGGGAVFHDMGNLNFTFLTTSENYDLSRQMSVIQTACSAAGIPTELSGRNDILADGKKFSGNAFYHSQGKAYHHGTLLVDADMDKLSRYLSPSKAKLEAKGVSSVRSRVTNLNEFAPALTCDTLREYLKDAFAAVYGLKPVLMKPFDEADPIIAAATKHNASWQWLYGAPLPFTFRCEDRFTWGGIQLQLKVVSGIAEDVKVYTDSMDWTLAETVEKALTSCRFTLSDMKDAISKTRLPQQVREDLISMLESQNI